MKDGPSLLWTGIFASWLILLSGVIGTPGLLQYLRLQELLESKQVQTEDVKEIIQKLDNEIVLLQTSKSVQQREIRRVLGYSAPDELIFDFSSSEAN